MIGVRVTGFVRERLGLLEVGALDLERLLGER